MTTRASGALQVAIHIDVTPGPAGGTAQSTRGLVSALGQLDGPEQFLLVTQTRDQAEWIEEYRGANQKVLVRPRRGRWRITSGGTGSSRAGGLRATARPVVNAVRRLVGRLSPQHPTVPLSDGFYESLGSDVLHFPTQPFVLCALPTVYNPHDLQHLHYPQFWTAEELARRETVYRAACHHSKTVVVGSEWIKQDVVQQYGIHPDKVQIIPWAPPTAQHPEVDDSSVQETRQRLELPDAFAFYPAVAWPHKNHIRLLEALAALRESRGLIVNLVCTGAIFDSHWPMVRDCIETLGLESQVRFLGFLSESDLRAVYRSAQFLVLPSLFEADSCPIHEAWSEGLPVASSSHTALPEQVGDAGLLFDAGDTTAIAEAIERMATDLDLRRRLVECGHRRVRDFDWSRTARAYRAVYRRAAGVRLNDEDRWLLGWDWMKKPSDGPRTERRT